jgi:hypothetical protein
VIHSTFAPSFVTNLPVCGKINSLFNVRFGTRRQRTQLNVNKIILNCLQDIRLKQNLNSPCLSLEFS